MTWREAFRLYLLAYAAAEGAWLRPGLRPELWQTMFDNLRYWEANLRRVTKKEGGE